MTKQLLMCPVCEHERADMTRLGDRYVLGCFSCEADGLSGGDWLRAVAKEVGAPGGGALKDDPERWLAPYINGASRRGQRAELPTLAKVTGWNHALMSNERALRHLRARYGVRAATVQRYTLGYAEHGADGKYRDYGAYTLPVFNAEGDLVNLRKRFWPKVPRSARGKRIKYVGLPGRGVHLYPDVPLGRVLLVAGEFDALAGRGLGVATVVTTTCGVKLPEHLAAELARSAESVAVMYDVGEERAAERTVEVLLAAGASEAWVVRLPTKRRGADLSNWHSSGGQRTELLGLINQARMNAIR